MKCLYNEEMYAGLNRQIARRVRLLLGMGAVVLAAVLFLLLAVDNHKENRPLLPVTLLVVLGGAAVIFFWDLLIRPLRCYAKHMDAALHGRTHEVSVVFDRVGGEDSVVDGVTYRDLIFLGDADKHGDRERMFYWDLEFPLPGFQPGQTVRVTYYDRFLTAYEAL